MDTNVNSEVDMDLLVDDQPNEEKDYLDNVNKEPEKQDPDPDKVVEADLEMDPAAATEAFIRKSFGLSVEDLEEEADDMEESGEEIIENAETVTEDEDSLLGIEPATPAAEETTVVVTPPAGGDTTVVEGDVTADATTDAPTEELDLEPKTPADVASLENLRAIYSREDEDATNSDDGLDGDVSLNVTTPNNDVDITLDDKAVTIEPTDAGTSDDGAATDEPPATPSTDDVEKPETDDVEKPETEDEEKEEESTDTDSSAESWWMI